MTHPFHGRRAAGARRIGILVRGVVQGVGFRPFVHNLATALDLTGFVLNSSDGVRIEVESVDEERLQRFLQRLERELPPLAKIEEMDVSELPPQGEEEFSIRKSLSGRGRYVLVSPDIATCGECLRELKDPSDRRFGYPFINCTHCGPRYTIIQDLPYDRPKTTMAPFPMCPACAREYQDPRDRRFHAQPIGCQACGPRLRLVPSPLAGKPFPEVSDQDGALRRTRELLRAGKVVAIRGIGGFHIACDATSHEAVARLREKKRRSNKPFAVMCGDLRVARRFVHLAPEEERILQTARRPICLLSLREDARGLSPLVAPGNRYLGVMMPYTPVHELLFQDGLEILVMTSGNWSEEPIIGRNEEAVEKLALLVDALLLHDREISARADDSVVRSFRGEERVVRRARGFVPSPIDLGRPFPEVLACGAEMKNTFCLTKDRFAILSQHIGDLENIESLTFFQETLENLRRLYGVRPGVVAHDLHPRYLSTQWAEEMPGVERVGVQHHHAHVVSCMAEHRLEGPVIGVAFDGAGLGEDGAIWGGEVLVADRSSYRRAAHLRYVPLPGGEAAIREPWRMAVSHLVNAWDGSADLTPWAEEEGHAKVRNVARLVRSSLHSPPTSSVGRLFDAVSSMLKIRHRVTFEGEAAMDLEMRSDPEAEGAYGFDLVGENPTVMDPAPAVRAIWRAAMDGEPVGVVGGRFHRGVAQTVGEVCARIRAQEGIGRVCLSGGVFQNMLLLRLTMEILEARGFEVFGHRRVPTNDGGISLGQAVVAGTRAGEGAA